MIEADICIIGAGPAGLMAGCMAATSAKKTILVESNTTAGRKLLLTGGGRCNLTHIGTTDEIIRAYKPFDRFVRHCLHEFSPSQLVDFFAQRDIETITEPNGCVFPKTNRSNDVKKVFIDELKKLDTRILYGTKVKTVKKDGDAFTIESEKFRISAKTLIIATGGISWPQTGSTGDGYKFAKSMGHNIIPQKACVVPLVAKENFCASLAGIGIPNVRISCKIQGKKISADGAMIFTHNGIGGPAALDISRNITDELNNNLEITIDLVPEIKSDDLEKNLIAHQTRTAESEISQFLPKALARQICKQYQLTEINCSQINKKTRKTLVHNIKNFPLTIASTEPIEKATVTRGGVDIAEIDPKTMQSKLCPALFFAGETINVDGPCGGYNLQFAFSSGALAGKSAVELLNKIH